MLLLLLAGCCLLVLLTVWVLFGKGAITANLLIFLGVWFVSAVIILGLDVRERIVSVPLWAASLFFFFRWAMKDWRK